MKKTKIAALVCILTAVLIVAVCLIVFDPFGAAAPEPTAAPVLLPVAQPPFAVEGFVAQRCDGVGALNGDVELVSFGRYTGPFVEDGSNEPVKDVLAILVRNTGEDWIEFAQLSLRCDEETAYFECKGLSNGAYALLLEVNRRGYDAAVHYGEPLCAPPAYLTNAVMDFSEDFALYTDDGVLNLQNISGADIVSEITLSYKNALGDYYLGGIVYRLRIEQGLAANAIAQRLAPNFTMLRSVILFMTYEK